MSKPASHVIWDGLRSLVAGLGTDRDKMTGASYVASALSEQQIQNAYRFTWMAGKIVDIPAEDSISQGRDWQANPEQITLLEDGERRLGLWPKLYEALVKARLWGGAVIYIGTDDKDLSAPLEAERIGKAGVRYLAVLSRREIGAGELDTDPTSETFNKPKFYEFHGASASRIHPSRFVVLHGRPLAGLGDGQGWGDSVLQRVHDSFKHADATAANIASLVFEANVDVFGVPNLMSSLGDKVYEKRLIDRFTLSATSKGINKAIIRDAEEQYDRKQVSFSTLPEVLQKFIEVAAGAADIPLTRFLGTALSGLGSNGDHSMKMYHKLIATQQRLVLSPALYRLDECLIRSALGTRPPEIFYKWSPLDQMGEKELAEVSKLNAETTEIYGRTGLFTPEELREAAINQAVELGSYPGLEQIVEEIGEDFKLGEDEESEAE